MADTSFQGNIDRVVRHSELENATYSDSSGLLRSYPEIGQGPGRLANEEDLARDELGFTHPNLHRRVYPKDPPIADDSRNQELLPRSYDLQIQNVHSYRTTSINTHDEESIDVEVP